MALRAPDKAHRAIRLGDLLDGVFGEAGGLVEAHGVGQRLPHDLGRLIEAPDKCTGVHLRHVAYPNQVSARMITPDASWLPLAARVTSPQPFPVEQEQAAQHDD